MTYQVIYSREAVEDLERLFDHVLTRELNSPMGDLDISARAIEAIGELGPVNTNFVDHQQPVRS